MKFRTRRQREQELAREIQDHLDLESEDRRAEGVPAAQATFEAQKLFGNTTSIKEHVRDMWGWRTLEQLKQDARFAVRLLLKNPGFATVAILTLALGIGANTAIFTVVHSLLLKPLPYKNPEQLAVLSTIFQRYGTDRGSVSYPDVADWKAQKDLFDGVSFFSQGNFDVTGGSQPERVRGLSIDDDYFRVLGASPQLGRTFTLEENNPEANRVVVLSHQLWMRRFGGDRNILQTLMEIGGLPHKVVGVMPKDATWPENAELFRPQGFTGEQWKNAQRRDNHLYRTIARLKADVSVEQAQAKLTAMGSRIAKQDATRADTNWKVHRLKSYVIGSALSRTLWVLLGAVVLVLLIACVNVANLLLARGAARQREVAIRNALGAGWKRLASQFVMESVVLAVAGGALGLLLGYWGVAALVRSAPAGIPRLDAVQIDYNVLAFTVGLCFLTAIFFGIAPVLTASRNTPGASIREGGRAASDGVRANRVRSLLVISEFALAVILLAGAGLLVRSFSRLQQVDPGFPTDNMLTMQIGLPWSRYGGAAQPQEGFRRIVDAVRTTPGVVAASATSSLPVGGGGFYLGRVFLTEGQPEPPSSKDTAASWSVIQPDYLKTMGIKVVAGRSFTSADRAGSTPVILISQSMAQQMFPGRNAIGRRIRSWRDENVYREIVGITGDLRYGGLREEIVNTVYVPHAQDSWGGMVLTVRTNGDANSFRRAVQSRIWSIDDKLAISEVQTMDEVIERELARPRFSMFLLGVFAVTALLMAAIGIYGLMSYAVAQRTREIGIRMALGALQRDILTNVTVRAFVLACAGVFIGIAGAVALTRLMTAILFGVSPTDSATFAMASGVLILVAILASFVPARRASKVDPLVALRYE